jgi:hypothetical protein
MKGELSIATLAAACVLAAGCGSGAAPAHEAGTNTLVCRHYLTQRHWARSLTYPTLADAVKYAGYISADAAQATPGTRLAADLKADLAAGLHNGPVAAAAARVLRDCRSV